MQAGAAGTRAGVGWLVLPGVLIMSQAVYLNAARAQQALALAEPTIFKLMETMANHKAIHIVILGIDGEILHEADIGPDVEAEKDMLARCKEVARGKARIHFRTGRPSLEVQARRPHA